MLLWIIGGCIVLFGFVAFFGAPYVPSKRRELEKMFVSLYPIGAHDVMIDLGSGDGVVLRAAAAKGARAIGYELNPVLAFISRLLSRKYEKIGVYTRNMWQAHFPPETTLVYVFGVSRDIEKIARKVQKEVNTLDHPISLISYGCKIPHMVALDSLGAHHLYTFAPLHTK